MIAHLNKQTNPSCGVPAAAAPAHSDAPLECVEEAADETSALRRLAANLAWERRRPGREFVLSEQELAGAPRKIIAPDSHSASADASSPDEMPALPSSWFRDAVKKSSSLAKTVGVLLVLGACGVASAQSVLSTNAPLRAVGSAVEAAAPALPTPASMFFSLFRVLGALAIVLAVFFGGLWLFRNWQRVLARTGQSPKLNILEVKSLGQRHALYVVGYEQQRLLIASAPTGITLLTSLPEADANQEQISEVRPPTSELRSPRFTDVLWQALQRSPRELARALRTNPAGDTNARGKS